MMTKEKKIKLIIILTVLVDIIGFGIVIPLLPFYVGKFSSSPLAVTWMMMAYSLCSFLSAPLLGKLSDRYGRRPVLIISILSTALGWFIFAFGQALWVLFLGRIIDGLAAGNITTALSSMSDISKDEKERSANMGLVGALFGLGFVIGPLLGGFLSLISTQFVFICVGIMALINVISVYFLMPETNNKKFEGKMEYHPLSPIVSAIKDKRLRSLYVIFYILFVGIVCYQSIFALYLAKVFNYGQAQVSWMIAIIGLLILINQAFLLKNFWFKFFKPKFLRVWSIFFYAISLIFFAINNQKVFFVVLIVSTCLQSVLRAILMSYITGKAEETRRGEAVGILSSVESLSMITGPLIVGPIYMWHYSYSFYLSAILIFIAFIAMYRYSKLEIE